jgi:hypothetical protein
MVNSIRGTISMRKNPKQTSPKVASKASKQLQDNRSAKDEKSVAGSALSQAPYKKRK